MRTAKLLLLTALDAAGDRGAHLDELVAGTFEAVEAWGELVELELVEPLHPHSSRYRLTGRGRQALDWSTPALTEALDTLESTS